MLATKVWVRGREEKREGEREREARPDMVGYDFNSSTRGRDRHQISEFKTAKATQ